MILIVAAHPDDEAVGAASILFDAAEVAVVHVTDGAPRHGTDARARGFESREGYAAARAVEARAALAFAGVPERLRLALGIVDQEASLRLAGLTRSLMEVIARLEPERIVTHAYEGGHPDHDATAFAVHAAVALRRAAGATPVAIWEMAPYHRGPGGSLESGVFLGGASRNDVVRRLDSLERSRKRTLLARYRTQRASLRRIGVEEERFRRAPHYDFTQPPHPGRLWFESFPWEMTAARFGDLVRYALLELGLRQAPEPAGVTFK